MSDAAPPPRHPFHLVDPSPWPLAGAAAVFVLAFGAVRFMHDESPAPLALGVALVLATMAGWWRDVVHEAGPRDQHTERVRVGLRVGMALFIASEVMFFGGFFGAFFYNALHINPGVTRWPPAGITPLDAWGLPAWNTLILLTSGVTLEWGTHAFRRHGDIRRLMAGLALSIALGLTFVTFQAIEYGHAAFAFRDGVFPSVFYMATGFHGFHVLVGVVFLAVCLGRAAAGQFRPGRQVGLQAASWYWHFVDAVWLFLFTWVYWWGGA